MKHYEAKHFAETCHTDNWLTIVNHISQQEIYQEKLQVWLYFLKVVHFSRYLFFKIHHKKIRIWHLENIRSHLVHDCIKGFLDAPDLTVRNDLFEERLEVCVPGQNAKHMLGMGPDLQGAIWQHFGAICIHSDLKWSKVEETE